MTNCFSIFFKLRAALFASVILLLAGCASDEGFSIENSGQRDSSRGIAGEATPAPEGPSSARGGWAW